MKTNKFNRFLTAISYILPNCLVPKVITEATIFQAVMRLKLERNNAMYELEQYNSLCKQYVHSEISVGDFNTRLDDLIEQTTMVD